MKDTFSTFNVSNPFQTLTRKKEPLAASGPAACLNSARTRAVMRNTETMARPLPLNYSKEGCLDKITKAAAAVFLARFSVHILRGIFIHSCMYFITTLLCIILMK